MSFRIRFILDRVEEKLPEPLFGKVVWDSNKSRAAAVPATSRSRSMDGPLSTHLSSSGEGLSRSTGEAGHGLSAPLVRSGGGSSNSGDGIAAADAAPAVAAESAAPVAAVATVAAAALAIDDAVERLIFFSGNPEIDVSKGVLKLFKDNKVEAGPTDGLPSKRSDLLCLLAVPAHYSSAEICRFLRAHVKHVTQMRVLRDQSPDRLLLVMRMANQALADEFYLEYNGVRYNNVEPERCKVAFLSGVEFLEPRDAELMTPVSQHEMPSCPVW